MQKQFHYLYKVTHIDTGRIYIGIHSTTDLNDRYFANGVYEAAPSTKGDWIRLNHGGKIHDGHIKHAMKKYGRAAFERVILEWFDSREDLIKREAEIVTSDFIERDDNFNHRTGGVAYVQFSSNVRKKISSNNPMKRDEVREKVSIAQKASWTPDRRRNV